MKPFLSVLMPGIRVDRWQAVYDSIARAYLGRFELVTAGPATAELSGTPRSRHVHIDTHGSPIRSQQLALLKCEGEWISWASDDGIFEPYALDDSMELIAEAGYDPFLAVTGRYTEGENPDNVAVTMKDDYYYLEHHNEVNGLKLPPHYLAFNGPYVAQRDALLRLGGWDCRFETIALGYCDFGVRWQNAGYKSVLQDGLMVKFGHMPGETGDHGPMHRAYYENDLPLFRKLYGADDALARTGISVDNWKDAPEWWERRFGK